MERCVVDLELCPFAAAPLRDGSLRIVVSAAEEPLSQRQDFLAELDFLQQVPEAEVATSLLVYSRGPSDFDDFLDLVDDADELLDAAGLRGTVQLAHFHPDYRFEDEPVDGLSHFTNRSPLPMLHLLREEMLARAISAHPDPENIPARNIRRLDDLGRAAVLEKWGLPAD